MKLRTLIPAVGLLLLAARVDGASVSFPSGNFEGGTAANWTPQSSGLATASTQNSGGNTFGRIAITGIGDGSLTTATPSAFQAQSLYVVSLDLRSSSITSIASKAFGMDILDGNGNVVATLDQSQLVGILGINLGVVSDISTDLTGLAGKVDLISALQPLLDSVAGDPALLASLQTFVNSLIGADSSVLSEVVNIVQDVLDGTLDPVTVDPSDLGSLLGLADTDPIVLALDDLLAAIAGNDGALESLQDLVGVLLAAPGDTSLVDSLLTTLVGEDGLVENVANILLYALADDGLLGTLDTTLTQSLLGVADPADSNFQTVKLIFSVGSVVPEGAIGVRLSADATAALGMTVDYDNVTIDRFALVTPGGTDDSGVTANKRRPAIHVRGTRLRKATGSKEVIRGSAIAYGSNNRIVRVEYNLRGAGIHSRGYRKARGREAWKIVVRPNEGRTRVRVRAIDANNLKSTTRFVGLVR